MKVIALWTVNTNITIDNKMCATLNIQLKAYLHNNIITVIGIVKENGIGQDKLKKIGRGGK